MKKYDIEKGINLLAIPGIIREKREKEIFGEFLICPVCKGKAKLIKKESEESTGSFWFGHYCDNCSMWIGRDNIDKEEVDRTIYRMVLLEKEKITKEQQKEIIRILRETHAFKKSNLRKEETPPILYQGGAPQIWHLAREFNRILIDYEIIPPFPHIDAGKKLTPEEKEKDMEEGSELFGHLVEENDRLGEDKTTYYLLYEEENELDIEQVKAILTYSMAWFPNYQKEIEKTSKQEEWVRKHKELILIEGSFIDILDGVYWMERNGIKYRIPNFSYPYMLIQIAKTAKINKEKEDLLQREEYNWEPLYKREIIEGIRSRKKLEVKYSD